MFGVVPEFNVCATTCNTFLTPSSTITLYQTAFLKNTISTENKSKFNIPGTWSGTCIWARVKWAFVFSDHILFSFIDGISDAVVINFASSFLEPMDKF